MFWVFGSLFLRRCGVSCASCRVSGKLSSTYLSVFALSCVCLLAV